MNDDGKRIGLSPLNLSEFIGLGIRYITLRMADDQVYLTLKISVIPAEKDTNVLQLAVQAAKNEQKRQKGMYGEDKNGESSSEEELQGERLQQNLSHFHDVHKNNLVKESKAGYGEIVFDEKEEEDKQDGESKKKDITNFLNSGIQGVVGIGGRLAGVDAQGAQGNMSDTVNQRKIEMLEKQLKGEKDKVADLEKENLKLNLN